MMKRVFKYLFIFLFCFSINIYAQSYKIEEIILTDTIFMKAIKAFINKRNKIYPKFKKIGYLQIKLLYFNKQAINNQLMLSYRIIDQYYSLNLKDPPILFPKYYSYFNSKLILIDDEILAINSSLNFTRKSKRKLIKIIEPYLNKKEHIIVKNENGKVIINDKNFRDESFKMHGGIILDIYKNGTYNLRN